MILYLVERCRKFIEIVLVDVKIKIFDLDDVILVGGLIRIFVV